MKSVILTTVGLINCLMVLSQTTVCDNRLDTAQIITIAKRHNAYWNKEWYAPSSLKFDEQECTWTVVSWKSKYTNRGQCKYTNGCKLMKQATLVINAKTKKVLSRDVIKELYPSYE